MNQASVFQYSYDGTTTLHPVGLIAVIALGIAMLCVKRRYALLPILMMACFVAPAQRIVIFGLNFTLLRLMVLFGWVRITSRGETKGFQWRAIDLMLIAWATVRTVAYTIDYGSLDAFINQLGESYDAIGTYFLCRCLIRDWDDLESIVYGTIWISIPVTIAFLIEHATRHNLFAFLGGVPEITGMRDGRLRCQGAFAHPILAGTFWASMLPMAAAEWWWDRSRRYAAFIGITTCCTIIVLCASSGPVAAVLFAILAGIMFKFRKHMRGVRWAIVIGLVVLQIVMKGPVWSLIARINFGLGGTGWYRFALIDGAINHFGSWWLIGTRSISHWGDKYNYPMFDVTNQYVEEGIRGGIIALGLFVAIIAMCFRSAGRLCAAAKSSRTRIMAWALGVSLFVHVMSFLSVSYFGQIIVIWYLLLGAITSLEITYIATLDRARKKATQCTQRAADRFRDKGTPAYR